MVHFRRILSVALTMVMVSMSVSSCGKDDPKIKTEFDRAMILYSAGFNSISSYLKQDIEDLKEGYLPSKNGRNVVLVIGKHSDGMQFAKQTAPVLVRLTRDGGKVEADTLLTLGVGESLADADVMHSFMEFIAANVKSKSYGLVLSSHATGWLPEDYFANPSKYDKEEYDEFLLSADGKPSVSSVTQESEIVGGKEVSHEMIIEDFAAALQPLHFDYILFDACLMGGIEVAYSLKDATDRIGFSQTEVLADGFDYETISTHLLRFKDIHPEAVCHDYFQNYADKAGISASATISYINCAKVDTVASVCNTLFSKYGDTIRTMDPEPVQKYFYDKKRHWHYDMKDIIAKAGASEEELAGLQEALDKCVIYKAATSKFLGVEIAPESFSGFSMYLPSHGSKYLNDFYRELPWNKATGLINEEKSEDSVTD